MSSREVALKGSGRPGGSLGGTWDVGGTAATPVLAVVIVEVAMAAKLIVGGVHKARPIEGVN